MSQRGPEHEPGPGPERGSDPGPRPADQTSELTARRGPDLLTLITGLGALGSATTTLLGGIAWFADLDGRWVLAGLALIIGLLLVIGSLRPQQR